MHVVVVNTVQVGPVPGHELRCGAWGLGVGAVMPRRVPPAPQRGLSHNNRDFGGGVAAAAVVAEGGGALARSGTRAAVGVREPSEVVDGAFYYYCSTASASAIAIAIAIAIDVMRVCIVPAPQYLLPAILHVALSCGCANDALWCGMGGGWPAVVWSAVYFPSGWGSLFRGKLNCSANKLISIT